MSPKRVLIVDDDAELVLVLATRCRRIGLEVQTAHNALTALTRMEEAIPDLVCLVVNMPTANGLGICELLAADPRTAEIPVIVLTGQRDAETIKRCRNLRARYMHKSGDLWKRVEPMIYELIDIDSSRRDETDVEHQTRRSGVGNGLNGRTDTRGRVLPGLGTTNLAFVSKNCLAGGIDG